MSATAPARKAVKTTQLPGSLASQQVDATSQPQDEEPASLYTVSLFLEAQSEALLRMTNRDNSHRSP